MSFCRDPLPKWFLPWEAWRRTGGIPELRPKGLPSHIPVWAWACYRERTISFDYGVLSKSGWFVRDHTSGSPTEKLPAVKAAGFSYIALNARDHRGNAWDEWRVIAARAKLPVVPWGRIYDKLPPGEDATKVAKETIFYLGETQQEWGSPGVALNIEDEAESIITPKMVDAITRSWSCSLAIVTDYRGYTDRGGYHGPNWSCLADRATCIMECFTNDDKPRDLGKCYQRAKQQGWKSYVPMLDTKNDVQAYTMQDAALIGPRTMYVLDIVDAKDVMTWA